MPKLPDEEQVKLYMEELDHPMKAEIEKLRKIILKSNSNLKERIKWNAPSYYYKEDIVTFGPPARKKDEIMLVFHHPHVVKIKSDLLEGDYKDRRLVTFKNKSAIDKNKEELVSIINEIVGEIEKK